MIALMFLVVYARFYMTKILNAKSNPLLEKPSVSYMALKGSIMQHKADQEKGHQRKESEEYSLKACLDKIKPDVKHTSAMTRSTRIRAHANYLAEDSLKMRKAYFCTKDTGYLK